jgi:quaternary ammonium compound-resistance protein SugE
MAWLILLAASVVEILMGLSLKYADGWSRPLPSILGIVTALGSVYLLTLAMKDLPVGTAYAAWTGMGAVGITILGMVFLGDPVTWFRIGCIALIIAAVAGLRFVEG